MKNKRYLHSALLGIAGLLLASTASMAQTATDYLNSFDDSTSTASWIRWWGNDFTPTWDGTVDRSNSATSGSMKYSIPYTGALQEQMMTFGTLQNSRAWDGGVVVDGAQYTNVTFDIHVDPSSGTWAGSGGANYGSFDVILMQQGWGTITLGSVTIPSSATNGWAHIVQPIDSSIGDISKTVGIDFKQWVDGHLPNTFTFWIDNLKLEAKQGPPPPPPSLKLTKVTTTGLQLVSSASDGNTIRQGIHAVNPVSWIGAPNPVSYSITITNYPSSSYPNLQTHIFLAPGNAIPNGPGDSSIDWNATNVIFVQIQNHGDGTAGATFMYKTNVDGGPNNADRWQGQIFGSNTLAVISAPTILGKWSVTFNNDTNVTITVPGGGSTNFVMPAASAAYFADPLYAVFGMQPNVTANIGQPVVFSNVSISGVATPADDSFTTAPLDTSIWGLSAGNSAGVTVVPLDSAYWVSWTLPDGGFGLQISGDPADSNSWSDPGLTASAFSGRKNVLIPTSTTSSLPGTNGFFRLLKPPQ
ncbi:hypothetical protein [Pedosphaera parvula]|uniref:Carbohydrate-binding CenC domain protein n=1 Tax=Pedosphaera parvula (strain Ellin514) TaxID=320771 RepID=B9XIK3_PEDPL|nr:hypothetical protein [Pedosphaera parvula]EEF60266.1 hypothetical protein Cflav_PD2962 [Pedosphaera parvula Ellin514]